MTEKKLAGKTVLLSGGSRGIGLAIALRCAADGANIAILAKTDTPHPKLEGTVHTAAEAIEAAGGSALPIVGDVRNDDDVTAAVLKTQGEFGGIDVVINNAGYFYGPEEKARDPTSLSSSSGLLLRPRGEGAAGCEAGLWRLSRRAVLRAQAVRRAFGRLRPREKGPSRPQQLVRWRDRRHRELAEDDARGRVELRRQRLLWHLS